MISVQSMGLFKNKIVPQSLVADLLLGNAIAKNEIALQTLKTRFNYDYSKPPTEGISAETYVSIIEYVRQVCFPDKEKAEGYFKIALASLEGHFQGPVGKINKIAARMFGIEKAAQLYIKTQKYNYPFGSHEMEEVRKGYLRYHRTNVPTPPDFTRGVLTHLVELIGGRNIKVSFQVVAEDEVIYEAFWD